MKKTLETKFANSEINRKLRIAKAKLVVKILNSFKIGHGDFTQYDFFDLWLENGFFVIPKHFYQPIPDVTRLKDSFFKRRSQLIGIDFNEEKQLKLLKVFSKFQNEYPR